MKHFRAIRALLLTGSIMLPASAIAQETGTFSENDIIVTATRRAETVQDVPINITAISGDLIQAQRSFDLGQLARTVPGIYIVDQGARSGTPIVFRGLNADPLSSFDGDNSGGGTVAIYVGEIPLYVDLRLSDMERVEFLLGPQGTLYGSGTLGGAIRYIPARPKFDVVSGEVRTDFYGYKEGKGISSDTGFTLNLPLASNLAFRGSFDYLNDEGFIDYPFLSNGIGTTNPNDFVNGVKRGSDLNTNRTISGRAALRYEPVDALDINLTYYYQKQETDGRQFSSVRNTAIPVPVGRYESALRVREPNVRETQLVALEMALDLGFAELTSASGYSKFTDRGNRDQTDLLISLEYSYEAFPNFTAFTLERDKEEAYTQELRLVSQGTGPLSWIIGGFYNKLKTSGESREFTPGLDRFYVDNFGGSQLYPSNLEYLSVGKTDLTEKAVYGELGYRIADQWQVTVGGRYYGYDLKTLSAVDLPLFETVFNGRDPSIIDLNFEEGGQNDSGFLWKINTSYKFSDDVMVYGTVSKGYRIGNSNGVPLCPVPLPGGQIVCAQPSEFLFGPDKTTNYEIGLKSQWFDKALTFNLAVYYIKWTDPQVSSATQNGSQPITINGAGARSQGFEVAAAWTIMEGLTVRGSYAYTDPQLTAFTFNLVQYFQAPGFGTLYEDGQKGDRLPGSPKHSGSIFLDYTRKIGTDVKVGFSYLMSAQSNVLSRTGARGLSLTLPGFSMHNASFNVEWKGFSAQLYVDNVFNKFAEVGVRSTPQGAQVVSNIDGDPVYVRSFGTFVLPPRSIGLRTKFAF